MFIIAGIDVTGGVIAAAAAVANAFSCVCEVREETMSNISLGQLDEPVEEGESRATGSFK